MKKILLYILATLMSQLVFSQQYRYDSCRRCFPFAKQVSYHEATNPDLRTITTDTLAVLFKQWEGNYVAHLSDGTAYVKNDEQNVGEDGLTTSEATGYGMVIEALMSGCLPGSQKNFDALYAYALKHHITSKKPENGATSSYLMGWRQFPNPRKDNHDSAVDGDLDIAYALLLAAVQWGNTGRYHYLDSARATLKDIIRYETDIAHKKFERGSADALDSTQYGYHFIRTSDFMPVNIKAFAKFTPDSVFWTSILKANYDRFKIIQAQSPQYGLFPDYIYEYQPGSMSVISKANSKLARKQQLDDGGKKQNHFGAYYGFNACRIPWRIGLDYLLTGDDNAKQIIYTLNEGVKKYAEDSVSMLSDVLLLKDPADPVAHHNYIYTASKNESADLNVIGPLCISAMTDTDKKWRTRLFQLMTDQRSSMCFNADPTKLGQHNYYEQTIRLICDIVITHNYWTPDPADLPKP
jgi:hypothetical protein